MVDLTAHEPFVFAPATDDITIRCKCGQPPEGMREGEFMEHLLDAGFWPLQPNRLVRAIVETYVEMKGGRVRFPSDAQVRAEAHAIAAEYERLISFDAARPAAPADTAQIAATITAQIVPPESIAEVRSENPRQADEMEWWNDALKWVLEVLAAPADTALRLQLELVADGDVEALREELGLWRAIAWEFYMAYGPHGNDAWRDHAVEAYNAAHDRPDGSVRALRPAAEQPGEPR